jgi:hypothetical protein
MGFEEGCEGRSVGGAQYDAVAEEKPRTRHLERANLKSLKALFLYVKLNDCRR